MMSQKRMHDKVNNVILNDDSKLKKYGNKGKKMCLNKRFFDIEFEADVYAAKMPFAARPYKCPYCHLYHITSQVKPSKS